MMLPEAPGGSEGEGEEVLGARAPPAPIHTPSLPLSCPFRVLSAEKRKDWVRGKESRLGSLGSLTETLLSRFETMVPTL